MAQLAAPALIERVPPHNLEAEMAVIGSVLVDREMMAIVNEVLAPSDFYSIRHETIFAALVKLYESGEPFDRITLVEELKRREKLDQIGGASYIGALMDTVPTAASAEFYAKIVREKSALRGLIHAGTQITQIGYEGEDDVDTAVDRSEQIVFEVGRRQQRGEFQPITKLLRGAFEQIDRLFHQRGQRTGVTSGFRDIDEYTAGFQPGSFVIIAARPSMGKTSMALSMALSAAREEDKPIAIFSLEMTNEEIVSRLLSAEARISAQNLRRGAIRDPEWERISDGMNALSQIPLYIDDSGSLSVTEVRSRCRRLKSAEGLAAVFIDYLQLLRPGMSTRSQNRNDELTDICRTLKATAKDLEVPIIALAQLNRAVETRNDKHPVLSDLRDCLPGDALVMNADTGARIPLAAIVQHNLRFNVWAVDERLKMVKRPITDAWRVGMKSLYRVTLKSGRTIRCTDGHRFLMVSGWRTLRELSVGDMIAVPRCYSEPCEVPEDMSAGKALLLGWLLGDGHLGGSAALTVATPAEADLAVELGASEFGLKPFVKREHDGTSAQRVVFTTGRLCGAGKNPLTSWLRSLGIWKDTGQRKHVPDVMFEQPPGVVAAFLRGLFHADGSLSRTNGTTTVAVRLSTISGTLAAQVHHLLLRFGINALLREDRRNIGGYRTSTSAIFTILVTERTAVMSFMESIGFLREKHRRAAEKLVSQRETASGHFDRLPLDVNAHVNALRAAHGFSHARVGWREQGKMMSRTTCARVASQLVDERLERLAYSDLLWDPIVGIDEDSAEDAYDLTVADLHNFCVDDVLTHNSGALEQEADIVAFLYRDAYYNPESAADPDLTEFIIAKQRNGPIGMVKLRFLKEHTLFVPHAEASHFSSP